MKKFFCRFALTAVVLLAVAAIPALAQDNITTIPKLDGKPADMTKPVQVFILLGQK